MEKVADPYRNKMEASSSSYFTTPTLVSSVGAQKWFHSDSDPTFYIYSDLDSNTKIYSTWPSLYFFQLLLKEVPTVPVSIYPQTNCTTLNMKIQVKRILLFDSFGSDFKWFVLIRIYQKVLNPFRLGCRSITLPISDCSFSKQVPEFGTVACLNPGDAATIFLWHNPFTELSLVRWRVSGRAGQLGAAPTTRRPGPTTPDTSWWWTPTHTFRSLLQSEG